MAQAGLRCLRKDIITDRDFPVQENVRNKWCWTWLSELDTFGNEYGTFMVKLKAAGLCYCIACKVEIVYDEMGIRAIHQHVRGKNHKKIISAFKDKKADGRPLSEIFPVGPDAVVNRDLVKAVRGAWTVGSQKGDNEGENMVWGAPCTKRKALDDLRDDVEKTRVN